MQITAQKKGKENNEKSWLDCSWHGGNLRLEQSTSNALDFELERSAPSQAMNL
jgi:hypothetical protein